MKELVIVLRWFIGFLTFLLGLMTLILFLKYIWDLVIIRNIILIVLSFGLFGMSLDRLCCTNLSVKGFSAI
ncbi:hypothetical protein APC34_14550 [Acinetobacter baumannii]|nr:hypothetical protein APC34_14550 [Acinetobacter baumannii]